ncbi:hypothetical protein RRG08_044512 [Elysia crispata]|uniref:Uncharacterized protein n=1 Tax=Elysia crispata TaxID=231223 RepID=A0AAE1DDB6_9GAST|nr:hypothetical protein RRG08_044512 [Elysia crispata]
MVTATIARSPSVTIPGPSGHSDGHCHHSTHGHPRSPFRDFRDILMVTATTARSPSVTIPGLSGHSDGHRHHSTVTLGHHSGTFGTF